MSLRFGLRVAGAVSLMTVPLVPAVGAQGPAPGRALAIEDYYRVLGVGAPSLSPDGRWVAFTVSRRIEATNTDSSQVWVVAASGTPTARPVSDASLDASSPQRGDDGRLRYPAAGRVWIMDPATPAAVSDGGGVHWRRARERAGAGAPA